MKINMNKTYNIFAHFLIREGWNFFDVQWEIAFLRKQKVNAEMSHNELKDAYFPKVRLGAKKKLSRKERVNVLLTLENSMNHASVA